jgi:AcrR family transcriptional regulator
MPARINRKIIASNSAKMQTALLASRNAAVSQPRWRVRRSEETRRSIMDATVKSLVNYGYSSTTIQIVADMIGLSRGAMVHHYATRMDIISAVTDHIFLRLLERVYDEVEAYANKENITHAESANIHWSVLSSDEYLAYLELKIAARTDEELRDNFDPKAIAFDALWLDRATTLLPHWQGNKEGVRLAWNFGRATLEGLKINERIVSKEAERKLVREKLIAFMIMMESGML